MHSKLEDLNGELNFLLQIILFLLFKPAYYCYNLFFKKRRYHLNRKVGALIPTNASSRIETENNDLMLKETKIFLALALIYIIDKNPNVSPK